MNINNKNPFILNTQIVGIGQNNNTNELIFNTQITETDQTIPDTVLYSKDFDLKDYEFSFKTADFLNKWAGLNIPNRYYYNSGNDFIKRLPFAEKKYDFLSGSVGVSGAKLGGSAGFEIAPGYLEAGFEVEAGYNLGEFNFEIPISASVNAGIVNNQFSIDIDANLDLPHFNYTFPYAYAYLDAVLGYDLKVDAFAEGYAEIGPKYLKHTYEADRTLNIIDVEGKSKKRIVQLDTRSNDNFIDLIYKRFDLGDDKQDAIPRTETNGYLSLDFNLPRFNGGLKPISGLKNEYIWEIKEERKLVDANFALDNVLAQIPYLKWLSMADKKKLFSLGGHDFALEYDWRAIALDLSASLNFGYNFKTGITDLLPKIVTEKSEIRNLVLPAFKNKNELLTHLELLDTDKEFDIDIVVEFNPKIIFEAEAYLKPEVNFDWDIGVVGGQFSPLSNREKSILIEGESINLYNDKIPIIPLTRREVSFKELYRWITKSEPNFTDFTLEIPFSALAPERYGSSGTDFAEGTDKDDPLKLLGKGDDFWVLSQGNDTVKGGEDWDTLILKRPESYTLNSSFIADSIGNKTTFNGFEFLSINARKSTTSGITVRGNLNNTLNLLVGGVTTDFNDTIENSKISVIHTRKGDDVVKGTLYERNGIGAQVITGEGNDTITVSKITTGSYKEKTKIKAGSGDDNVNLTVIPTYTDSAIKAYFDVDLGTGSDTFVARTAYSNRTDLRPVELLVNGHIGGKTIDIGFTPNNYNSEVILNVETPVLRNLFGLGENAEVDNLFINVVDSTLNYSFDNSNSNTVQIQDKIVQVDKLRLDLTDAKLASYINIKPQKLTTSEFIIDSGKSFAEVLIDTSAGLGTSTDIANLTKLKINGDNTRVKVNEVNFLLTRKLSGTFPTLDLSAYPLDEGTGIYLQQDFITKSRPSLDINRVVFTEGKDTILFNGSFNTPVTTTQPSQFDNSSPEFMYFHLGEGDDRFHDRPGFRQSGIYPGSGNDFIYGGGGFDTVYYEEGSRLDYQIKVIDNRTVEVFYQKDGTTDTLIDVEEINFENADELVVNPYYQGPDANHRYTTFTLQVNKEYRDWNQPAFIYSPWTHFVPFETKEITLTKDFLLSNIYDIEGDEDKLEISYIDISSTKGSSLNPKLDTTDSNADIWKVTVPEGLNADREAVIIEYTVDDHLGSSQDNFLYIYPNAELSYISENEALDLTTSSKSESIEATKFNDTVSGGDGKDFIQGMNGDDVLKGDGSNDYLEGNQGNDTLYGGAGNDNLFGGDGRDEILGGSGADQIVGGQDDDILWGGADADRFVFYGTKNEGIDVIKDFNPVESDALDGDRIEIHHQGFGLNPQFNYDGNTGNLFFNGSDTVNDTYQVASLENKPVNFDVNQHIIVL
ncbi:MAG: hypothetical protein KI793_05585 [Rivularia sp. (in: Bacteria)]|nr:hypothetical protein [Rivularia sp. MS3]